MIHFHFRDWSSSRFIKLLKICAIVSAYFRIPHIVAKLHIKKENVIEKQYVFQFIADRLGDSVMASGTIILSAVIARFIG